jgi:hypothetical protein
MNNIPKNIVKFIAPCGWEDQFNDFVVRYCVDNKLVFVDRAAIVYPTSEGLGCSYLAYDGPALELPLIDEYAWFQHHWLVDLPFTSVVPIPVELL